MTTPPLFPGFDGLMTLSRREGVDIRPTLLRVLTDLYVQASMHSEDEARQFVELTSRLIDQVDDATRAAVRARLAVYPGTPIQILKQLGLKSSHPDQRVPRAQEIPVNPIAVSSIPASPSAAPSVNGTERCAAADGLEFVDAASGRCRNQWPFFRRWLQRARSDPAQSCRHAVEGFAANSCRARGTRHRDAGDGGFCRGRRKLHPRTRRSP